MNGDPFFLEDIDAARALLDSELFLYSKQTHLFADPSPEGYDAAAAAMLTERVLAFLDTIRTDND